MYIVVLNISGDEFLKIKSSQVKIQRPKDPHEAPNPTFLLLMGGRAAICGCLSCLTN